MKHYRYAVIACCLFFAFQGSEAQARRFGLGVIIGEPAGISAKLWTSNHNAFDFGLGWSVGGDRMGRYYYYNGTNRVHVHMDYLWHSFDAIRSSEQFSLFYGIGGRINSGAGYEASVAVRGVLGIAWLPRETPIDIFLELVPMFQLTSSSGFGLDAGVGARYFF
ncbi:MAG: DUF3996 domain-containing protein [Bacteroidota bacterium]|nr:DUF3996 domain-containing protein [Bacteroidota bacterium]